MSINKIVDMLPRLAFFGALACALVIAVLSLLPGSDLPAQNLNDKLNHFIAYGALTGAAVVGRGRKSLLWVAVSVTAYGLALEVLQGIMPYGRSASWLDAVANTGGVLIGVGLGLCLQVLLGQLRKA